MEDRHGELLAIALMARDSGEKASSLWRVPERFNEVIAFEFDFACTSRLKVYDEEKETRLYEAMDLGSVSNALGGPQPTGQKSGAVMIEAGWQVPDA